MTEINHIIQTRKNFISLINNLNEGELNCIPKGFKNNISWNFGHIVVAQQILCYKNSGLKMYVSEELIQKYKKGSFPNENISKNGIENLIKISDKNMELFEQDFQKGLFKNYTEYTTSYNITLSSIEDAMKFNSLHESLHFGYAMALQKLVK